MTDEYDDALTLLNNKLYDAVRLANTLARLADYENGQPEGTLKDVAAKLRDLAAEIDCIKDHGMSRRALSEVARMRQVYEGEKRAGLHSEHTAEGIAMREREMRGHE